MDILLLLVFVSVSYSLGYKTRLADICVRVTDNLNGSNLCGPRVGDVLNIHLLHYNGGSLSRGSGRCSSRSSALWNIVLG